MEAWAPLSSEKEFHCHELIHLEGFFFGSRQRFVCVYGFQHMRGVFMVCTFLFYFPCLFCVLVTFFRSHDSPMSSRDPWTSCGHSAFFLSYSSNVCARRFPRLTSSCRPLCILIKSQVSFYDLVSNLFRCGRPMVHAWGSLSPVAQTALGASFCLAGAFSSSVLHGSARFCVSVGMARTCWPFELQCDGPYVWMPCLILFLL